MRCKRKGCEQAGAWFPTLLVHMAGHDDLDLPPAELAMVTLPICSEHRQTTTPAQLVNTVTWPQLEARFGMPLDRNRADTRWERVQ